MKAVNVKLEDDLHLELKIKLVKEGITFNEYILNLIKQDMKKSKEENK